MPTIALQQVSSQFARENAACTLHKPIALRFIARHLSANYPRPSPHLVSDRQHSSRSLSATMRAKALSSVSLQTFDLPVSSDQ
jgi:hypothetical protein